MARSRNHSPAAQPPSGTPASAPYIHLDDDADDKIEKAQQGYALDDMRKGDSASSSSRRLRPARDGDDDDDKNNLGRRSSRDVGSFVDADGGDGGRTGNAAGGSDGGSVNEGEGEVYRVYKRRWFGLVALTCLNIIASWDWLTFSPISQHAAEYYGTTESTINWLSTSTLFTFVAASPVTVWMLHLGVKPSILTAAALLLVGNWVRYGGSTDQKDGNIGVVIFGQILCGAAQAFVLSAPTRYSDLWFSSRGRVAATAVMSLANPLGAALGQLFIPMMVSRREDVSDAVLYVSVIATAIAVPSCLVPAAPPTPPAPSGDTPKEPLLVSLRRIAGSLEIWLLLVPFGVFVGLFNSISTLLNQVMEPHGFSSDDAGLAGAVLIVVGLVASAVSSPVLDRTKAFLLALRLFVPVIGLCYLVFIWMPATRDLAGPMVVLGVLGAASFSLVPVALEFLCELAHPCSPEVTSTIAWASGQLLGGCFILISDACKAGPDGHPPANMDGALIFHAVIALATVPVLLSLGLFGRQERVKMRRVTSDTRDRGRDLP